MSLKDYIGIVLGVCASLGAALIVNAIPIGDIITERIRENYANSAMVGKITNKEKVVIPDFNVPKTIEYLTIEDNGKKYKLISPTLTPLGKGDQVVVTYCNKQGLEKIKWFVSRSERELYERLKKKYLTETEGIIRYHSDGQAVHSPLENFLKKYSN